MKLAELRDTSIPISISIGDMKKLHLYRDHGLGCVHPHPIYNPSYNKLRYWLYYTPYPPDEAELPYLAISTDGVKFTRFSCKPLISRGPPNSWDDHHLADIDIVKHNGTWYMYYAGATYINNYKRVSIGLAVSKSGLSWRKYKNNPVLEPDNKLWYEKGTNSVISASCPTVYVDNRGRFYLYYAALGSDGISRIVLATSMDGFTFEKTGIVLQPEYPWERRGVDHPHVSILDKYLILLYLAHDLCTNHIGLAIAKLNEPSNLIKIPYPIISLKTQNCRNIDMIYKLIGINIRRIIKYYLPWLPLTLPSPLWNRLSLYRAAILTYPDKRIAFTGTNTTYLYISAYDLISRIPSIGIAPIRIQLNGVSK